LKPTQPAEPQQIVSPLTSVTVMTVLLNVAFMWIMALATLFLTLRLLTLAMNDYPQQQ
jgi:hypothetical protein